MDTNRNCGTGKASIDDNSGNNTGEFVSGYMTEYCLYCQLDLRMRN